MDMRARRRPARCAVGGRARAPFPNARARAARHSTTRRDAAEGDGAGPRAVHRSRRARQAQRRSRGHGDAQRVRSAAESRPRRGDRTSQGRGGRAEDLGRDQGARAVGVQRDERDGGVGAGLDGGDREPVLGGGRGGDLIARGTNAGRDYWVQS